MPEELTGDNDPRVIKFNLRPFLGQRISCGLFGISDDYIEKYQSLDSRFIKNKSSTFFFEATGSSMEPLIIEKDVLIVDRSLEATHDRVVVVSLDNEMLCKRLIKDSSGNLLRSDNRTYRDIYITEEINLSVFGVVIGIARDIK